MYDQKVNWLTTIVLAVFHIGAVAALFMFNWWAFAVAVFLIWMATGLGISMGYHRLHTHRSYKVPLALEYFFAICGASDARRRADLLGRHPPDSPSELGSARRSALAARWRLVGARRVASLRRSQT